MSGLDGLWTGERPSDLWRTCRLCKQSDKTNKLIHYSTRHYAHPDCLLKEKGEETWQLLHDWQLKQFPALAASRAGLFDSLMAAIKARESSAVSPPKETDR
jgi:hypothetical protein